MNAGFVQKVLPVGAIHESPLLEMLKIERNQEI